MNILLTGSTGFVGQHFLNHFQKLNQHKVFAISRRSENPTIENVTWIPLSKGILKLINENSIEVVIHLAGKAHDTKNTSKAEEYFEINYGLTKHLFDDFVLSSASKFIFLSTIKAVGDDKTYVSNSDDLTEPQTPYSQSKRKAEKYIQDYPLPSNKKFYILRPTLIYGPGVKGNLATLVKFASKGLPYPFVAFENKRSYLSINNLIYIFQKLTEGNYLSFTVNLANEDAISTKELISIVTHSLQKRPSHLNFPASLINLISRIGDILPIPLNSEKLKKITSSFVVDTSEMTKKLGFHLPEKTRDTIYLIINN